MSRSKRSLTIVSALFAVLLSSAGTLAAPEPELAASLIFAAARSAKQQCVNTCRARYRSCRSLEQIPSFECRGVYQDCARFICHAPQGRPTGRLSWPGS